MAQLYTKNPASLVVTNPIIKNASFGTRQERTVGVTHQETSTGFVVMYTTGYSAVINIGPSSASINVAQTHFTGGSGGCGMMAFLPKNWYWYASSGTCYFIPLNFA